MACPGVNFGDGCGKQWVSFTLIFGYRPVKLCNIFFKKKVSWTDWTDQLYILQSNKVFKDHLWLLKTIEFLWNATLVWKYMNANEDIFNEDKL